MKAGFFAACCAALLAVPAMASRPFRPMKPAGAKKRPHPNPELVGKATFDQWIDHTNTSMGTFKQRYWWDARSWKGPGSPVFVFNPGEEAGDLFTGYLENATMPGLYADMFGGAAIVIEHRFWGESLPFKTLTAETLQYHNLMQAAYDMAHFANTVKLEFADGNSSANADKAPWVLIGGSYSGALAAWTSQIYPGAFWAYHASSAVVEAIYHFWQYFLPMEEAVPRNCSADVHAVVSYVDNVLTVGNLTEVAQLKNLFGLEKLTHDEDFTHMLSLPLSKWQENQTAVFEFCDYVETYANDGVVLSSHEHGIGLQPALKGYASYMKENVSPMCQGAPSPCDTYTTSPDWDDPTDFDGQRQWDWMLCDWPMAFWQTGPPTTQSSNLISTHFTPEFWQRQCALQFPEVNGFTVGSSLGFTTDDLNMYTGGWNSDFERVIFTSGKKDPWLYSTPLSPARPGGPLNTTDKVAVFMVDDGAHVPDLILAETPDELNVNVAAAKVMKKWLAEWKP